MDTQRRTTADPPGPMGRALGLARHPTVTLVVRFVVAGVLNTLVGVSVALALDLGLRAPPALANAAGYAVGITVSWLLQRGFVFRSTERGWGVRARYLTTIAVSFGLNQLVLQLMHARLGDTRLEHLAAQVTAMATYTVVQFILFRTWVFRQAAAAAP